MVVTEWLENQSMGIRHCGLITGAGRFELRPLTTGSGAEHTDFTWTETLRFGWQFAGPLGAAVAAPVLRRIWRRNLARLAGRFR